MKRLLPFLSILLLATLPAAAQSQKSSGKDQPTPERIAASHSWTAWTYPVKGGKVCYVVGEPVKTEPDNVKRGSVDALVTHNTADKTSNVVSFIAGYPFAERSEVKLAIDGKDFSLFTDKDTAWARDSATDKAIVEAMIKGERAVVKGTSSRGTNTTDTYSLIGFTRVITAIDQACGVKR
jgi:hypothetical protein